MRSVEEMRLQSLAKNTNCLCIPHTLWKGIPQLGGSILKALATRRFLFVSSVENKTKARLGAGAKRMDENPSGGLLAGMQGLSPAHRRGPCGQCAASLEASEVTEVQG